MNVCDRTKESDSIHNANRMLETVPAVRGGGHPGLAYRDRNIHTNEQPNMHVFEIRPDKTPADTGRTC